MELGWVRGSWIGLDGVGLGFYLWPPGGKNMA